MSGLANVTRQRSDGVMVATVSGEIDFSVADDVGTTILESLVNEDTGLILDLSKLSYTDSAGINLVFALAARLREHRQTFSMVLPADSQPWRTFAIAGIQTDIPVFETLALAKAAGEETPEL